MSRRRAAEKRDILPDAKFGDQVVAKFINCLMNDGKKSVAEHIVYSALDSIGQRSGQDPVKTFHEALDNVKPSVEVRSRRVGGATYQVPVEVRQDERLSLSFRWLITFAKSRGEKTMSQRLAGELMDASSGQGRAVQRREETHRMAEANRAFAHYRW